MTPDMPTRPLGDLRVTVAGLGCNNFGRRVDLEGTRAVVDAALEAGVTFFDTADTYGGHGGSEKLLGKLLEGRRDQVVLATKFGADMGDTPGYPDAPRGSARYIGAAIDWSLARLKTDYIDLYQYHLPDGVTPILETLTALDELVRAGTVRAIGCSNFSADQLEEAEVVTREAGLTPFISIQNHYNLLEREIEAEITPLCERLGVGILPYFPLASGLLTGKYRRGQPPPAGTRLAEREVVANEETFDRIEALAAYAEARGIEVIDVAIGGLAAQRMVACVIAGATTPEQVRRNAQAARWVPSAQDLAELDAIVPPPVRR
jgi:aryl-alcohol dehydrogenase-like predicted oxidoreductase